MGEGLADLSATELVEAYRRRECSPVDVVEAVLDRLTAVDGPVHAVVTVAADRALAEARRLEAVLTGPGLTGPGPLGLGRAGIDDDLPPLFGVPVTVKDLTPTEGIATTRGSRPLAGSVPVADAAAVARLRAAGALVVGKTNTSEGGWKADTDNPLFGPTANPWDPTRSPGGSSGGTAAAVAMGIGPIGLGTDGAGSIRIPAAFCGVVGIKASFGRVPYVPPSAELLSHIGPLARTVDDAVAALDVMAGADERDPFSLATAPGTLAAAAAAEPGRLRVALVEGVGGTVAEPEVRDAVRSVAGTLSDLGHRIEPVGPLPDPYPAVEVILAAAEAAADGHRLEAHRFDFDPGRVAVIERGLRLDARTLALAEEQRFTYAADLRRRLDGFDLVLTPTVAVLPFPVGAGGPPGSEEVVARLAWAVFSYPFNLTGWPAVSVPAGHSPAGHSPAGLPIGVQLVGRWHDDGTVLAVARQLETARPWRHTYKDLMDRLTSPSTEPERSTP